MNYSVDNLASALFVIAMSANVSVIDYRFWQTMTPLSCSEYNSICNRNSLSVITYITAPSQHNNDITATNNIATLYNDYYRIKSRYRHYYIDIPKVAITTIFTCTHLVILGRHDICQDNLVALFSLNQLCVKFLSSLIHLAWWIQQNTIAEIKLLRHCTRIG